MKVHCTKNINLLLVVSVNKENRKTVGYLSNGHLNLYEKEYYQFKNALRLRWSVSQSKIMLLIVLSLILK